MSAVDVAARSGGGARRGARRALIAGFAAACVGTVAAGITAFACTPLPDVNLDKPFGNPGEAIQVTGRSWDVSYGAIQVRWDSLAGPLLARATPNATGILPPLTVTVPATAQPGYHMIIATAPGVPETTTRALFQVLGSGPSGAQAPRVAPSGTATTSTGLGAGAATAIGALGASGLLLFGAGIAGFARSYGRAPAPRRIARR